MMVQVMAGMVALVMVMKNEDDDELTTTLEFNTLLFEMLMGYNDCHESSDFRTVWTFLAAHSHKILQHQ